MAKYELALVVNAKIEKEARVDVVKRVDALIERFGGKLGATTEWGKKRLAYEIQKMTEGYFYFIHFESDNSACPNELELRLRITENVLRYLIIRMDDEAEIGEPNETDVNAPEAAPAEEAPVEEAPAEEAVEEAAEEAAPAEEVVEE